MNETPFGPQGTLIGRTLGDYELLELLTSGGMARIYKGIDVRLQRYAAVKVLMRELLDSDETLPERFQREARAVAQLDHPHIMNIYQTGEQDGYMFIAMRLIEGNDLADEITKLRRVGQMMEPKRALAILQQVADALDYAHARGIIHRDFKPSNVLLDAQDRAYLTDFGLALWQSKDKTMGTAFGTPRYIAPEQALASETAVPQSDIYAMAVVLYEILTGDMLFRADTPMQIALSHISEPPPPPRIINPNIPETVEKELLKALSKDAKARHQTAGEFIRAVAACYDNAENASTLPLIPPRPPTESSADHPSTVIIPDARTPVSQRLEHLPVPSPVPTGSRRIIIAVSAVVLAVVLMAAAMLIIDSSRANRDTNETATAAQAFVIAALSATHTPTASETSDFTPTPTLTDEPTATDEPTTTPTDTATFTHTPQATATDTPDVSASREALVKTETSQWRATDSALAALVLTDAALVTATETPTTRPTSTATDTPTDAPTATPTVRITATDTVTATNTRRTTATNTRRPSPTALPTESNTPSPTHLPSASPTEEIPVIEATSVPTDAPVTLLMSYDSEFFVVKNTSSRDADVSLVTFNGAGMAAQRLGGSLPLTTLRAGSCSVIHLERRTVNPAGYECATVERPTQVSATSMFWRGTAASFVVMIGGEEVVECPLAARGQPQTCEVVLP